MLNIDAASTTSLEDTQNTEAPRHQFFDTLGILGSALCLLHCISTPLLVGTLGLTSIGFLHSEWIHKGLAIFLVPIAASPSGPASNATAIASSSSSAPSAPSFSSPPPSFSKT